MREIRQTRGISETREMKREDDKVEIIEETNYEQFKNNPDEINTKNGSKTPECRHDLRNT